MEEAIEAGYEVGRSLSLAAFCAFRAGSAKKGKRYAKEAHARGYGKAFLMWERGEFRIRP